MDRFTRFEHDGWQGVADKYDSVWSSSTRQFIPPLLEAADVSAKMSILDVGCGPGYVSAAAAERACAEACRVLKPGGRFGFTTWAQLEENPFVKLVDDAIQAHANLDVSLPEGPPYFWHFFSQSLKPVLSVAEWIASSLNEQRLQTAT